MHYHDSPTEEQRQIGTRRDPSWRRGVHEGAAMALRLAADGWTEAELSAWLERVGEWRFDPDAGELPPSPKTEGSDER